MVVNDKRTVQTLNLDTQIQMQEGKHTTKSNKPHFRVHHEPFPGQVGSMTMLSMFWSSRLLVFFLNYYYYSNSNICWSHPVLFRPPHIAHVQFILTISLLPLEEQVTLSYSTIFLPDILTMSGKNKYFYLGAWSTVLRYFCKYFIELHFKGKCTFQPTRFT